MKNVSKKIKRKAYFFSDCSIPASVIIASLAVLCNTDDINEVENCAECLKRAIYETRLEFPNMSIDEWYLVSIECYIRSLNVIQEIKNTNTKTWVEYRSKNKKTSEISEKIFLLHKKIRGKRK